MEHAAVDGSLCLAGVKYRPLASREECATVVSLEREIWGPGYDEAFPVAVLLVSAARGAVLIGAFDGESRMIGFVYSMVCIKDGLPMQWSYKLGVLPRYRNEGVGMRLKLLQRERAIELGVDLIQWTFDPMLAPNAYLNLTKLGVYAREYAEDLYGESLAPVTHRNIPTDRLIVTWKIRDPWVEQHLSRLEVTAGETRNRLPGPNDAVTVNRAVRRGEWLECAELAPDADAARLAVEIPMNFSSMVPHAPALALEWRLSVRKILSSCFARGYRAVEFFIDPANLKGTYLLVRPSDPDYRTV